MNPVDDIEDRVLPVRASTTLGLSVAWGSLEQHILEKFWALEGIYGQSENAPGDEG